MMKSMFACALFLELLEKSESFIALQKWKNATEFIELYLAKRHIFHL